jgi:hypothetical protein
MLTKSAARVKEEEGYWLAHLPATACPVRRHLGGPSTPLRSAQDDRKGERATACGSPHFNVLMKRMIDWICESLSTPEYTGMPASTFS